MILINFSFFLNNILEIYFKKCDTEIERHLIIFNKQVKEKKIPCKKAFKY